MKKLLIIFFVCFGFLAKAQVFTPMTAAGYQNKRTKTDSTNYIPTFCGVPTLRSTTAQKQGAIALDSCNKIFYFYDPKTETWNQITGGGSTINIFNDTTILICSGTNVCDTFITNVTANYVSIFNDSTLIVCNTEGACDTININPTNFGVSVVSFTKNATQDSIILTLSDNTRYAVRDNNAGFDTTTVYQNIQNVYNYFSDTSFTNQFFPRGDGVLLDTVIRITDSTLRFIYTDGTQVEDTFRIALTQENITNITNIINYIDSLRGNDTTFILSASNLQSGLKALYSTTDSLSGNDTLHLEFPHNSIAEDSVLTTDVDGDLKMKLASTGGNDSSIIRVYVTADSLYQVFEHDDGRLDSFVYVSGHPYLTLTTTGSGAATLDVPNQILNVPTPDLSGKLNISDTATMLNPYKNKVDTIYRTPGKDSIQFKISGRYHAIRDSIGSGGGGGSGINIYNTDSSLTANRTLTLNTHTLTFTGNAPTATGVITSAVDILPALTGHANNDTLIGLRVNPTFSGAFSFMRKYSIWADSDIVVNKIRIGHGLKGQVQNLVIGTYTGVADSSTGINNTIIGRQAYTKNILGTNNVVLGNQAYELGTGGGNNTALGTLAMGVGVVTSSDNVAVGYQTFKAATSGQRNVAIGKDALLAASTSSDNTAVGWSAGAGISTGSGRNTAIGFAAGSQTSTGTDNVSIGYNARGNGGGGLASKNTAIGVSSLDISTGDANVGLGYYSGKYNTSGASQIFLNSLDRATYLRDQNESPFYAQQNATILSQKVTLNGKVGIDRITPTAFLELPRSDGDANTAPLKIPAPLSLTTTNATWAGGQATITFATQTNPPFILGSKVVVAGITPSGYNGTFAINGVTATTITYLVADPGGSQSVAGTASQGSLLGTPESGAIETDGTHLYWTDSTGTRKQLD